MGPGFLRGSPDERKERRLTASYIDTAKQKIANQNFQDFLEGFKIGAALGVGTAAALAVAMAVENVKFDFKEAMINNRPTIKWAQILEEGAIKGLEGTVKWLEKFEKPVEEAERVEIQKLEIKPRFVSDLVLRSQHPEIQDTMDNPSTQGSNIKTYTLEEIMQNDKLFGLLERGLREGSEIPQTPTKLYPTTSSKKTDNLFAIRSFTKKGVVEVYQAGGGIMKNEWDCNGRLIVEHELREFDYTKLKEQVEAEGGHFQLEYLTGINTRDSRYASIPDPTKKVEERVFSPTESESTEEDLKQITVVYMDGSSFKVERDEDASGEGPRIVITRYGKNGKSIGKEYLPTGFGYGDLEDQLKGNGGGKVIYGYETNGVIEDYYEKVESPIKIIEISSWDNRKVVLLKYEDGTQELVLVSNSIFTMIEDHLYEVEYGPEFD